MFALFLFAVFRAPLFVSFRLTLSFAFHDFFVRAPVSQAGFY